MPLSPRVGRVGSCAVATGAVRSLPPRAIRPRAKLRLVAAFALSGLGLALALSVFPPAAKAQSVTVFGNSDAQQCYLQTRILAGTSALSFCTRALEAANLSKKDRAATLVNRGINYTRLEQHDLAFNDFQAALALIPDLAEAYLNRGNTYVFTKQFTLAIKDYDRALELGTKDAHAAYFNRGLAYEGLRDLKAAYRDFVLANRLQPEWRFALERLRKYQAYGFEPTQVSEYETGQ